MFTLKFIQALSPYECALIAGAWPCQRLIAESAAYQETCLWHQSVLPTLTPRPQVQCSPTPDALLSSEGRDLPRSPGVGQDVGRAGGG